MLTSDKKQGRFANRLYFTKRFLIFFLFGALLIVGLWMVWPTLLVEIDSLVEEARHSPWRDRILEYGLLAPLVSIAIIIAQLLPLPIPGPTIPMINGWLYGLWGGAFITWLGFMSKAIIGYILGLAGRRIIEGKENKLIARFKPYLERYGWRAVMVARMIPLFPFTPISSGAALIGMPWHVYLLASGFGSTVQIGRASCRERV